MGGGDGINTRILDNGLEAGKQTSKSVGKKEDYIYHR